MNPPDPTVGAAVAEAGEIAAFAARYLVPSVLDEAEFTVSYAAHRRLTLESWPSRPLHDLACGAVGARDDVAALAWRILVERGQAE